MIKKHLHSTEFVSFDFDFDFDFFSSFLSVLVCFVFSLKDYFSYFLMETNFCGWI